MLSLSLLLAFISAADAAQTGAKCNNVESFIPNSTNPLVALTDLGLGTYGGKQGGLYLNGTNNRPPAFNAAGIAIGCPNDALVHHQVGEVEGFTAFTGAGVPPCLSRLRRAEQAHQL